MINVSVRSSFLLLLLIPPSIEQIPVFLNALNFKVKVIAHITLTFFPQKKRT